MLSQQLQQAHQLLAALGALKDQLSAALASGSTSDLDAALERALRLGVRADLAGAGPTSASGLVRKAAARRMAAAHVTVDAAEALRQADQELARACLASAGATGIQLEVDVQQALEALVALSPSRALRLRLEQASRSGSVHEMAAATAAAKATFFENRRRKLGLSPEGAAFPLHECPVLRANVTRGKVASGSPPESLSWTDTTIQQPITTLQDRPDEPAGPIGSTSAQMPERPMMARRAFRSILGACLDRAEPDPDLRAAAVVQQVVACPWL